MLKLFLMTGQNQYARGLICDLLVQFYQCRNGLVPWKLFMADLHCFNEEAGEISLSVLSRMTQGNTEMRNFDRMARRYRMSRAALQVSHFLDRKNRASIVPPRIHKYNIDVDGEEVTTTVTFFKKVIRQCVGNLFQTIDPSVEKIKRTSDLSRHLLRASSMPKAAWIKKGEVLKLFVKQITFIKEKWFAKGYCEFAHNWFDRSCVDAARLRMRAGDDFETVLDEELRVSSEEEDEETEEDDGNSDDQSLQIDISSEESSSDGPPSDEDDATVSLNVERAPDVHNDGKREPDPVHDHLADDDLLDDEHSGWTLKNY